MTQCDGHFLLRTPQGDSCITCEPLPYCGGDQTTLTYYLNNGLTADLLFTTDDDMYAAAKTEHILDFYALRSWRDIIVQVIAEARIHSKHAGKIIARICAANSGLPTESVLSRLCTASIGPVLAEKYDVDQLCDDILTQYVSTIAHLHISD